MNTEDTGPRARRIRYGTVDSHEKKSLLAGENRAGFDHEGWLRLVDTEKAVVTGLRNFREAIVDLGRVAGGVRVESVRVIKVAACASPRHVKWERR